MEDSAARMREWWAIQAAPTRVPGTDVPVLRSEAVVALVDIEARNPPGKLRWVGTPDAGVVGRLWEEVVAEPEWDVGASIRRLVEVLLDRGLLIFGGD